MNTEAKEELKGTGDASIEELMEAAREENQEAVAEETASKDVSIEISDEDITDEDFFNEFMEYFDTDTGELKFTNIEDKEIVLKVERLGIRHLRKYQKRITAVASKLQDGSLPAQVERDEAGEITSMKILWMQAWPLITDIIIEDLLELIMDSISIKDGEKFRIVKEEEFDLVDISDFPFIVVPWIQKNFADPKRRSPWQRMVAGLLRKFGIGK